ncbi:hypothetical protein V8E53_005741 [Lactarius tabidus]
MRQSKNDSVNARVDSHRKGKGRVGDIWGSKELMYVLKNVFENNWYGPGSRNTGQREKKRNKLAKEVGDNEEDEGEERTKFPTSLDHALATAFAYNLTNPKVVASASCYRVADETPSLSLACAHTDGFEAEQRSLAGVAA